MAIAADKIPLTKDGIPDKRFGPKPERHELHPAMLAQQNGRKRGVKNRVSKDLKIMIEKALDKQNGGGVGYLDRQAKENPVAFMNLLGKILPKQLDIGVTALAGDLLTTMQHRRDELAGRRILISEDVIDADITDSIED